MKKFLALVLALIMCCSLLACNDPSEDEVTSASDDTTTTDAPIESDPPVDESVSLIENGSTAYGIVRAEGASQPILNAVHTLNTAIQEVFKVNLSLSDDWVKGLKNGETYESDAFEILIGKTNRKESKEVIDSLKPGEYTVAVVGNKLVLAGYSDYLTLAAVNEFVEHFVKKSDGTSLKLEKELSVMKKAETVTIGNTDATVRVMTFNVLGSSENYKDRIPYINQIIEEYAPGIIGFQECNKAEHTDMVAKLSGYAVACLKHDNGSTYVYTPIVYKADKYTLLDAGVEWLNSRYTGTNTKSVGWAVFEDMVSGDIFGVINIHGSLWSNSYTPPDGKTHEQMFADAAVAWKEDNVRQMNDIMTSILAKHGNIPMIWTGDFNFNSNHSAYKKITGEYGMHEAEISATVSVSTGTKTTHSVGAAPASGLSIDHIFGNSKVIFRVHYVCASPDELKASDHCAVFADLLFQK